MRRTEEKIGRRRRRRRSRARKGSNTVSLVQFSSLRLGLERLVFYLFSSSWGIFIIIIIIKHRGFLSRRGEITVSHTALSGWSVSVRHILPYHAREWSHWKINGLLCFMAFLRRPSRMPTWKRGVFSGWGGGKNSYIYKSNLRSFLFLKRHGWLPKKRDYSQTGGCVLKRSVDHIETGNSFYTQARLVLFGKRPVKRTETRDKEQEVSEFWNNKIFPSPPESGPC